MPECWVSGLRPGSLLPAPSLSGGRGGVYQALAANTAIITVPSPTTHPPWRGRSASSRHVSSTLVPRHAAPVRSKVGSLLRQPWHPQLVPCGRRCSFLVTLEASLTALSFTSHVSSVRKKAGFFPRTRQNLSSPHHSAAPSLPSAYRIRAVASRWASKVSHDGLPMSPKVISRNSRELPEALHVSNRTEPSLE